MLLTFFSLLGTGFVSFIGWITVKAIDVERRVAVVETKSADIKDLLTARFDSVDQRLDRIEQKQDRAK